MERLRVWKERASGKPLLVLWARQTGKSWLLSEFGRRYFKDVVRLDFMLNKDLADVFAQDLDPRRIVSQLELLGAMSGLPMQVVLQEHALFTEFKGSLTEQYVFQELVADGFEPVYWSNEAGRAETDFSVALNGAVLPIEVKAGENLRSKSLRVACDKFGLERAIRTSLSGYRDDGWLVNIPLWAIGSLRALA